MYRERNGSSGIERESPAGNWLSRHVNNRSGCDVFNTCTQRHKLIFLLHWCFTTVKHESRCHVRPSSRACLKRDTFKGTWRTQIS